MGLRNLNCLRIYIIIITLIKARSQDPLRGIPGAYRRWPYAHLADVRWAHARLAHARLAHVRLPHAPSALARSAHACYAQCGRHAHDHACGRHAHDSTHCSHSTRPVPHAPTPSATRAVTAVQSTDTPPRRRRRACAAQRSHMRPARSHARSGCSRCAG